MTLVAVVGEPGFEKVVAVGNYFLEPATNLAEVAFSVTRDWQKKGISTVLQRKLANIAREHGIGGLVAYTHPANRGMIALFKKLPYKVRSAYDGEVITLTARFDEPAEPAGRPPAPVRR